MYTTYAMTLATKKWTEGTRAQLIERVESWRQQQFPADKLPGNVRIRTRHSSDDEVYRLAIETTDVASSFKKTTILTVAPNNGRLVFDVRVHNEPGRDSIVPRKRAELPPRAVIELTCTIANMIEVYDAERRVAPSVRALATSLDGEALAADVLSAPTRRLPIIVESTIGKSPESTLTGALAIDLVGIAHVVHVTSTDAIAGFNQFFGSVILDRNYVSILWPKPEHPYTINSTQPSREQIVDPILIAAALQPAPAEPPQPRATNKSQPTSTQTTDTSMASQLAMLRLEIEEHRLHIEQLDEELERTFEEGQMQVEDLKAEVALLRGALDEVSLLNVNLEMELVKTNSKRHLPKVLDAVYRARNECLNLEFATTAFETAAELQGPIPLKIFYDLKALDAAVAAWRSDTFPSAGLTSYLRDTSGLDFVARIGDDTFNRRGSWYTITHNGESLHIGAHLRAGKNRTLNRIYLHVDSKRKRIVVGKIVDHGPDGTS
jgi:hypothetical protein